MSEHSSEPPVSATLSTGQSEAVLGALDRAFEQVVGARYAGGVSATRIDADGHGPVQILRASASGAATLLLSYAAKGQSATLLQNAGRMPGTVIGHVVAQGSAGDRNAIVLREIFDPIDINHRDGGMQRSGVVLRTDGDGAEACVLVMRTTEQAGDADQATNRTRRGVVPPAGRHAPRAALGLGGGSHRPSLQAFTRRPIAGLLLGRFGSMLDQVGTIQPRPDAVTLGLLPW